MPKNVVGRADHAAPEESTAVKLWNYTEPARLRAVVAAVVALCAALGIAIPFDLPAVAEAAIALLAVLVPLVQGESTRAAVFSPITHQEQVGRAAAGLSNGPRD
jgi:hypothetical protein